MRFLIIVILVNFFGLNTSFAKKNSIECEQWQVIDIDLNARVKTDKPLSIIFSARLTSESGKTMDVPGFYNGDNSWVMRFSPPLTGRWSYETYSENKQLSGIKGTVNVVASKKSDVHGPVVISRKEVQRFEYADGSPYFLMAFELDWLFALDADNPDDIPKTKTIIEKVKANKFNQIVMNVYAYDASWGERDKIAPENNFSKPASFPFAGTNDKPDYSKLNIEYFKRLDRVISYLNDSEIISHLMIYVWNKKVNWPMPESEADNMYFDYVVKRYQAFPNIIWDISKEALAYGHDNITYITGRIDRLRELDAYNRLLSVHDYGYCSKNPAEVDFISIQEWKPNLYSSMMDVAEKFPDKPVFNIEHGGYEKTMHSIFDGAYTDPYACLDRNYQCIFAGTYSTYYWQNTSWYEVIYDPGKLKKENQPNFQYYKNLVTLFETYDFGTLKPYQGSFASYCLTDHSSVYLFYLPENMIALTGEIPELKGKQVKMKWFDTFTGKFYDGGTRSFENGTWLGFDKNKLVTSPNSVVILEVSD